MQDLSKPHADSTSKTALYFSTHYPNIWCPPLHTLGLFYKITPASPCTGLFLITWAYVATGVLVPDWCLTESRGTHFSVTQDTSLPTGAACALVQVPGLPLHIKFSPRCSAHHHVHPLWLTAAWLIYSKGGRKKWKRKVMFVFCYQIHILICHKQTFI